MNFTSSCPCLILKEADFLVVEHRRGHEKFFLPFDLRAVFSRNQFKWNR